MYIYELYLYSSFPTILESDLGETRGWVHKMRQIILSRTIIIIWQNCALRYSGRSINGVADRRLQRLLPVYSINRPTSAKLPEVGKTRQEISFNRRMPINSYTFLHFGTDLGIYDILEGSCLLKKKCPPCLFAKH